MNEPLLTICIPTYQNYQQLQWCIYSLIANTEYPLKVIIINNDPTEESQSNICSMIESTDVDNIEVIQPGSNMKWMGAINIGLAHAISIGQKWEQLVLAQTLCRGIKTFSTSTFQWNWRQVYLLDSVWWFARTY